MKVEYKIVHSQSMTQEEKCILPWGWEETDCSCSLIRYEDGVPVKEIFNDEMEPEDATLYRDLSPLVEEIQRLAE